MGLYKTDALARSLKDAVDMAVGARTNDVVAWWLLKGKKRKAPLTEHTRQRRLSVSDRGLIRKQSYASRYMRAQAVQDKMLVRVLCWDSVRHASGTPRSLLPEG